jgi:TolA-binding protein
MIRRFRPLRPFPFSPAWLVLACFTVGPRAAGEPAASAVPKPATAAATAPAPVAGVEARPNHDEIQSLLKLGANLSERADYPSAEIAFRQVLQSPDATDPEHQTALLALAQMHRRQGALTKAAAIYERFLKEYPGDERTPEALLNLGRTLRDLGTPKLAIARFYNVINSTLKLPGGGFEHYQVLARTAQFEIAETHFLSGNFTEAGKFFARLSLLDLAPVDRARAQFKSGYALRLQGDVEGAVRTLRSFVEQWPQDENIPEARYLLAISLRELNRTQEAFAATLDLLRTEKTRVDADPKRWAYWQRRTGNQLANDFFETGDTLNARAIYASLLELSAEPAWRLPLTYQLGLCYERLGVIEKARTSYQAVIEAAGTTPPEEFRELVTMAKWRIEHIEWRGNVSRQVTHFFDSNKGTSAAASPGSANDRTAAAIP